MIPFSVTTNKVKIDDNNVKPVMTIKKEMSSANFQKKKKLLFSLDEWPQSSSALCLQSKVYFDYDCIRS